MERALLIILGAVAIYAALAVQIAFPSKTSKRIIAFAAAIAVVCGLIFYGICFAEREDRLILAILKTCQAICLLFVGENSMDAIAGTYFLRFLAVEIIFSALGFLGIFTTAGAAISTFGSSFLQRLRLFFRKKRPLFIILSLTPQTLELSREIMNSGLVVFVDKKPDSSCLEIAREAGCIVRSDDDALVCNIAFLQSLGGKKINRTLSLYALSDDLYANQQYAQNLSATLQRAKAQAYVSLFIFANEYDIWNSQIYTHGQHIYNDVFCVSQEQLAAHLLMQKSPPWEAISFDENAKATEDFHALLVGGGKIGQAVIKQLVMNGQFSGSNFTLSIFDPEFDEVSGQLYWEAPEIFNQYNITYYPHDGRSRQMYQFLQENMHKVKYVVICTGNDSTNDTVAQQMKYYFHTHNCNLPIHICSRRGLKYITSTAEEHLNVFSHKTLNFDAGKKLNHIYCRDANPQESWNNTSALSRMSSRASADYAPAFLRMVGLPSDAIPDGRWYTDAQLENMAISEHLRWCAFHYCMGFRTMTKEEFTQRIQIYLEAKAANPQIRYRIIKDESARIHRLLISWDELDVLSAEVNAITGGSVDYKQMDRDNVTMLPQLLKAK